MISACAKVPDVACMTMEAPEEHPVLAEETEKLKKEVEDWIKKWEREKEKKKNG